MTTMKVELVDKMGSDLTVVNAARVSFNKHKDFLEKDDLGLIRYLAKHKHWTPFGHPQVQLRMSAPVFIRTQCFKHKQGFVENEVSRRYVDSSPEFFYPDAWRGRPTNGAKQGSGTDVVETMHFEGVVEYWDTTPTEMYVDLVDSCTRVYESMIKAGVAPEQARMVLPQSMMTEWYWTGSLAAYSRFYALRSDPHAQKEIQDLAEMVGNIIEPLFPYSWEALTRGET